VKVLITSASSAGAHKLKNTLQNAEIVLGDQVAMPAFMRILKLPPVTSDAYAHEMLTLCLDQGIDTVYLLDTVEARVLLLSKQLFKEYNIDLLDGHHNL
jgi:adenine/guanine phosphoribosyltransferase-like PRPP-binding protein